METLPVVSERAILDQVGSQSLERGRSYFRQGAIFDARRQGRRLKARCEGSQAHAYRVQVTLDEEGIAGADCSCPVGGGGRCKHVAALLLTWQAQPGEFTEVEELEAALERRSKAELIALIKQMLRQQPDLEVLLETPLPVAGGRRTPVKEETYRRQAAAAFRHAGHEWGVESGIADDLGAITEIGDGFREQGDFAAAAAVYGAVAREVLENFGMYHDESGELIGVVQECVEGLSECLQGIGEDTDARASILETLFEIYRSDIVDWGGISLADEVPNVLVERTTSEERRTIAGWVRAALPRGEGWTDSYRREALGRFLLDLEAETLDDETFLLICRETGRLHDLTERLLSLGRLDEAVTVAREATDYSLMGLADLFIHHGEALLAERLVRERSEQSQDTRLLAWLKQRHEKRGEEAPALELAERIFRVRPDLAGYQEIRTLAQRLGRWERLRPELLSFLSDQPYSASLLIQIHLDEGEIDRALELVKAQPARFLTHSYDMRLEVAEAAEATRPREALEIYRQQAEALIAARGRGNYQSACDLLQKVRDLFERLGEPESWTDYVNALREQNRSLRALKEEMAAARL